MRLNSQAFYLDLSTDKMTKIKLSAARAEGGQFKAVAFHLSWRRRFHFIFNFRVKGFGG
jgi:hypothetical protein